jgi:phosphate transport system substrate-binding protein
MTSRKLSAAAVALGALLAGACGPPEAPREGEPAARGAGGYGARDQIRIVGSSTVYPFSTKVAEQFGRTTRFKTPVVESTGTGGGFKLFCAGVGIDHPDITNASRAIKESEAETCRANGIAEAVEIPVGHDGIVIANAIGGPSFDLTLQQLFLALAREVPQGEAGKLVANPYKTWREVDASLPAVGIEVLGPPPTSGTRDAFAELALEAGCKSFDWIAALEASDGERYKSICHSIREDGAYVEAGENDNLIVQKLVANPRALGVFGYSFLDQNRDKLRAAAIDGIEPTFEAIADGDYPVSRPIFFYVKRAHVGVIPGIPELVREFVGERAMGEDGYLAELGLIPLPADELEEVRRTAAGLGGGG